MEVHFIEPHDINQHEQEPLKVKVFRAISGKKVYVFL